MKAIILSKDTHALLVERLVEMDRRSLSSVECDALDALIEDVNVAPAPEQLIKAAIDSGANYGTFVNAYGVAKESSGYALAAQDKYKSQMGDDCELDEMVIVERSLSGAFVSTFLWVSAGDAGAMDVDELLPAMLSCIHQAEPGLADNDPALAAKVDFVADLISDPATLHSIACLPAIGGESKPTAITIGGVVYQTTLCAIIREVANLAAKHGFEEFQIEQLDLWLLESGAALSNKFYPANQ